jgi:fibronectin type 3 domain-containing protein
VSWDAVAGATKYYVEIGPLGGPFTFLNSARGTSLEVAHLTAGTEYCFQVYTEDGTGPGAPSAPTCGTTPDAPPPPDSVLATQTSPSSINVQWTAVTDATKYYVYQAGAAAGPYSYINTSSTTSLGVSGLTPMAVYCFKVQADGPNGPSALSAAACNNTIAPPTNVTATRLSTTRARVDWTGVTGATKYYIYETRAGSARRLRATVLASAAPTYTAASLTTGVQYCYQLRTQGSPTSNVSGFSLPPACVTP